MLGTVAVAAAPAVATAPAGTSAFCKTLLSARVPDITFAVSTKTAGDASKLLLKLAKESSGSLKSSTKAMAALLKKIANGGSPKSLLNAQYFKAGATFATAAPKCPGAHA